MNTKISITAIICAIGLFTGCTNPGGGGQIPWLTPAAIAGDVRDAVAIGLIIYPQATNEVGLARDIICKESGNTNFTTLTITDAIDKSGITDKGAKLIIQSALFVWHRFEPYVGTNVHVYAEAFCLGMREGTGSNLTGRDRALARKSARPLPPHLKP